MDSKWSEQWSVHIYKFARRKSIQTMIKNLFAKAQVSHKLFDVCYILSMDTFFVL